MELKNFIIWLKKQPSWIKIIVLCAICAAVGWGATSCATGAYTIKKGIHCDSIYQKTWIKMPKNEKIPADNIR